ncbi:MAG: hypothetical protein KBS59_05325 [Clostridiales bacterium]|nr:hypothetical protein [Clostridiales bacterium]
MKKTVDKRKILRYDTNIKYRKAIFYAYNIYDEYDDVRHVLHAYDDVRFEFVIAVLGNFI